MFKPIERAAGHEDKIDVGREGGLVGAEALAEAAFGAGAGDGVAHRGAGGDETGAGRGGFGGRGGVGRRDGFVSQSGCGRGPSWGVEDGEGAAIEASADASDMVEIPLAAEVLLGTETHDGRRRGKHETPSAGPGFR